MRKITINISPGFNLKGIISTVIYLGTLSAVFYVCNLYTSPLTVLQILLSWPIIYNTVLLLFGTPPAVDNIYFMNFLGGEDESLFYPYLDGSHNKFLIFTEIFIFGAHGFIVGSTILGNANLQVANLLTLLFSFHYWRKLILLLRGICRYGKTLENSRPNHYVQQGENRYGKVIPSFFLPLFVLVLFSLDLFLRRWLQFNTDDIRYTYTFFLILLGMLYPEIGHKIISIIAVTVFTVILLHFAGIPYSLALFFLFLTILFAYMIWLREKDVLLRESHIYLSDELTCDVLKNDVKAYVQSLLQGSKYALYLAVCLYSIFIALLFSVIFRLDFARQFSEILGLDYFFNIIIP